MILTILSIVFIECLLSIDNAAVLAIMVRDLPESQQEKALHYGIVGAYVFRGLALVFASYLIQIWWMKVIGGLYLIYLCIDYIRSHQTKTTSDDTLNKKNSGIYVLVQRIIGTFWATVLMIEIMDIAFSIDNVFAVVAFTDNMWAIIIGVFSGILAIRFVAGHFVTLLKKYPALETSVFTVIGILGTKLALESVVHFYPASAVSLLLTNEKTEIILSLLTLCVFFLPVVFSRAKTIKQ
jgi:YkoY family integral membrane protein